MGASRSKRIFYFLQHKNNKLNKSKELYGRTRTKRTLPEQFRIDREVQSNQETIKTDQPEAEGDEAA